MVLTGLLSMISFGSDRPLEHTYTHTQSAAAVCPRATSNLSTASVRAIFVLCVYVHLDIDPQSQNMPHHTKPYREVVQGRARDGVPPHGPVAALREGRGLRRATGTFSVFEENWSVCLVVMIDWKVSFDFDPYKRVPVIPHPTGRQKGPGHPKQGLRRRDPRLVLRFGQPPPPGVRPRGQEAQAGSGAGRLVECLLVCWVLSQSIPPLSSLSSLSSLSNDITQNNHNHKRPQHQAKALLEKGCARSYGPACFNLAVMYKKGDEGVPK